MSSFILPGSGKTDFDARKIIDALGWLLARWAVPTERPEFARFPHVENVHFAVGRGQKEGMLRIMFESVDHMGVDFEVDMGEFLKAPEESVSGILYVVRSRLSEARKRRLEMTRIEIDDAVAAGIEMDKTSEDAADTGNPGLIIPEENRSIH